jgi:ferrous iron transport protein A
MSERRAALSAEALGSQDPERPAALPAAPAGGLALDRLDPHRAARITAVDPEAAAQPAERARQLADLGFVPGEFVTVIARAWPGGDPLVVRVGHSRFALRRAEAACVRVQVLP